jgi:hypothetical protein
LLSFLIIIGHTFKVSGVDEILGPPNLSRYSIQMIILDLLDNLVLLSAVRQ